MSEFNVIGELDTEKLEFIKDKNEEIFKRIKDKKIIMWNERVQHIAKHKDNFYDSDEFDCYVDIIPDIIENPDYIGIREKDSSLQFIKVLEKNLLVAVRVNTKGKLSFRTFYPITDSQINDYLRKGTAWKYKE